MPAASLVGIIPNPSKAEGGTCCSRHQARLCANRCRTRPDLFYRVTMYNFWRNPEKLRYNGCMARGWESKSVEAQIEAKPTNGNAATQSRTADQVQHLIEKRNLELARAKVAHELELSHSDRYSHMLQQSLSELDRKIAGLK
jgi:hypothetical protein